MKQAIEYVRNGYALVPFSPTCGKGPSGGDYVGWNLPENIVRDEERANRIPDGHSLGVAHIHCVPQPTCALDVDDLGKAIVWMAERGIDLPALLECDVQISSGRLNRAKLLYRTAELLRTVKPADSGIEFRCQAATGTTVIDLLPPSQHPQTGKPYEWKNGDHRDVSDIPDDIVEVWRGCTDAPQQLDDGSLVGEGGRNVFLFKRACSLRAAGQDQSDITAALLELNKAGCSPPLSKAEVRKISASACKYPVGHGDILTPDENGGAQLIVVNEDSLAQIFADQHKAKLRFSHDSGKWFVWDETRWKPETTQRGFHWCRELCRQFNPEGKRQIAKAATAHAVERYARADPRLAMRGDEWDRNPFLLVTPAGTYDLKRGVMRPASQFDLTTKSTSVAPSWQKLRLWPEFLKQVTHGDHAFQRYLQQLAGYGLTGDIREEVLFFPTGPGGSGKTTIANVFLEIWGDYATVSSMDVFTTSNGHRHPTDLAALRGARLVTASETVQGRTWDSQRVKALTGGDPISARFMRMDFFTYRPEFKLLLLGNHKPRLDSVDDSWRRRFHIIPFSYRPKTPDLTLKARLREEYPGILQWAIEGCADWLANGLIMPEAVRAESASYFEAQNVFQEWLDTRCYVGPTFVDTNERLFASWREFCETVSEPAGSGRVLADRLAEQGFTRIKNTHGIRGRGFLGVKVKPTADDYYRVSRGGDAD